MQWPLLAASAKPQGKYQGKKQYNGGRAHHRCHHNARRRTGSIAKPGCTGVQMNDASFNKWLDDWMQHLEDCIDEQGLDMDTEQSGGVLTLLCEATDSHIIISRQQASCEVWVAAKSGGHHFRRQDDDSWRCAGGETLDELVVRAIAEQGGGDLQL